VGRGARQWFELSKLLIQPILAPQNTGTTSFALYIALTLPMPCIAVRSRMALALAADADGQTTFYSRAAQEKAAPLSAQLRRWMLRKNRTRLGVLGPLGALERSICACGPRGGWYQYLARVVLMTMMASGNDS
jgi:hypothetical protein